MQSVTELAVRLDIAMLHDRGVAIAPENTPDENLSPCNPADHLQGRLLIKYIRPAEVEKFSILSGVSHFSGRHFVTMTPIASQDVVTFLALPPWLDRPAYSLLLHPERLTSVRGPRRIDGGFGIEYLLQDGFSTHAIAGPGWPIEHH